jgi:trans-aconitate 2-methyltransferase
MMAQQDAWDPAQYHKFARERAQAFWDLAGLIHAHPIACAVDLGCGSGELTAQLRRRFVIGELLGIDTSPAMLTEAQTHAEPGLGFELGDLASWTSQGDMDLVFANASLQWVPDHPGVLARWWAGLAPGGQLAVQMPSNADHPSHTIASAMAASEPFLSALGGAPPPDQVAANVLAPEQYAIILDHLGASEQHVRLQVYGHVLASSADVVEWTRGTTLTRIFAALPAELHEPFLAEYRTRVLQAIGDRSPYFYPFKRILFWASR